MDGSILNRKVAKLGGACSKEQRHDSMKLAEAEALLDLVESVKSERLKVADGHVAVRADYKNMRK